MKELNYGNEEVAKTLKRAYQKRRDNSTITPIIRGGSIQVTFNDDYVKPYMNQYYPQLNMSELRMVDSGSDNPYYVSYVKHPYGDNTRGHNASPPMDIEAGFISKKDLKKGWRFAKKNIVKPALKEGIKYAREPARAALMTLGVPKPLADVGVSVLSNLAEKGVEGLGYNVGEIGVYGSTLPKKTRGRPRKNAMSGEGMCGKGKSGGMASTSGGASKCKSGGASKAKARGQLIKKLMNEKGMKLAEASKYIKENNLSY